MKAIVRIEMTLAEAEALWVLIGEGREGILTDDEATKGYLGGKRGGQAAIRACDKFAEAMRKATLPAQQFPKRMTGNKT